jgi:hypothetical protein
VGGVRPVPVASLARGLGPLAPSRRHAAGPGWYKTCGATGQGVRVVLRQRAHDAATRAEGTGMRQRAPPGLCVEGTRTRPRICGTPPSGDGALWRSADEEGP